MLSPCFEPLLLESNIELHKLEHRNLTSTWPETSSLAEAIRLVEAIGRRESARLNTLQIAECSGPNIHVSLYSCVHVNSSRAPGFVCAFGQAVL